MQVAAQPAQEDAAAPRTALLNWGDDRQCQEAQSQALGLRNPAEGRAAQSQFCPGDPLLLLPWSHGCR